MTESRVPKTGIGHPWFNARYRDIAWIVVEVIDRDPSVMQVAHDNLKRWSRRPGGMHPGPRPSCLY